MTVHLGQRFSAIIREPLLHFALIGLAVFLLFPGDAGGPAGSTPGTTVIEIGNSTVDRLAAQFEATWNRPPNAEETAGLIESHIRQEVLYREALALGLDSGDAVIRQRLRLKMEFIGEAVAAALVPTDADLAAWYAANADDFTGPAIVDFDQVMLADPAEAEATLAALASGADQATLGRGTLLPARVDRGSALAVDGAFGPGFFDAVAAFPPGAWSGPIGSAYGAHLVRLESVFRPAAPPLDDVRDAVIAAWKQEQADLLREAQYQALRARYDIRLPDAAEPDMAEPELAEPGAAE